MAKVTRTPLIGAGALLAAFAALGCGVEGGDTASAPKDETTGEAVASLTNVPTDGICLVLTFTNGVTTTYTPLTAAASTASVSIGKLPAGAITITPKAYNVASASCNSTNVTTSTVPTWVGAAATVTIVPGLTTQVPLVLRPNTTVTSPVDFLPAVTQIAVTQVTSYALLSDGTVKAWGYGSNGQLGDGSTSLSKTTPVTVTASSMGLVSTLASGSVGYHMCALNTVTTNNTNNLYCWGYNSTGQLGNNTTTQSAVPVAYGTNNYSAVTVGNASTWALLRSTGGLWAWGSNGAGQIGNGTTTPSNIPVSIGAVFEQIGGGYNRLIARSSRTVSSVGYNGYGQLGIGNTTDSAWLTTSNFATGAWPTSVSAGYFHSCAAVSPNGAVQCSGYNAYGQLGDGTMTNRNSPVAVSNLLGAVSVSCGGMHTCAIKNDGTIWCWGGNAYGTLGDGTSTDRLTPVQVVGITDAKAVAAGDSFTCALRSDATVWCWGNNSYGEIGDGTTFNRAVPTKVLL